jgi:branched-chain amino acid transport system substrate-binding protein
VVHDGKTILLNPNAGASPLAGALCSPYIFTTGRMNPLYAEALGRYMAKKGIKSVALAAANFAAGLDMVQGFKETFVNEGEGKVVGEVLPPLTTTDFAPFMAQLKSMKADAVFAFFAGEAAVHFIKQYAQAGLKGKLPLYVTGYTVEQDVLGAQGDAALGILSVSVYSPMLDNDVNKKFAPAYKEKYGNYPSEYSVLAYDSGQLLLGAVNSIGGKIDDKVALLNAISTTKIDSPRGAFKFGPNHTPVQDAYLREVVRAPDGKLVNKMIAVAWPSYYYPGEGCMLPGVKR